MLKLKASAFQYWSALMIPIMTAISWYLTNLQQTAAHLGTIKSVHYRKKVYRIAGNFRWLNFCGFRGSVVIRENINHENFNPRIPGICEWDRTVLARSGRGLGAAATTKILTAKIQKQPICEILTRKNFQLYIYIIVYTIHYCDLMCCM